MLTSLNRAYQQPYSEYKFQDAPGFIQAVGQNVRPTIPPVTPPILGHILKKCWNPSPDARPSMNEVITELETVTNELAKTQ
jgi:hypothetical protein